MPQTSEPETTTQPEYTILVNIDHPLSDDYTVELATLSTGEQVAAVMVPDLKAMFKAMKEDGVYPFVNSAYRSLQDQQDILDSRVAEFIEQGYGQQQAYDLARELVATPESSEHRLGLALDLTGDTDKGTSIEMVQQWLSKNAYLYGFILRYPADKTELTGYEYEPWHYRYVGKQAALKIYIDQLCLEEYIELYPPDPLQQIGEAIS